MPQAPVQQLEVGAQADNQTIPPPCKFKLSSSFLGPCLGWGAWGAFSFFLFSDLLHRAGVEGPRSFGRLWGGSPAKISRARQGAVFPPPFLRRAALMGSPDAAFHGRLLGGPPGTGPCMFLPGVDTFPRSPASRRHCNPRPPTLGSNSPLCSLSAAVRTAGFQGCPPDTSCKPTPVPHRAGGQRDQGLS